jgi:uncharacterized protein YecA (UPF0149 family)
VLAYYLICRVLAEELEFSKDAVAETFFRASCLTKRLGDEAMKRLRVSDACPCGSGRRFGDCHGS